MSIEKFLELKAQTYKILNEQKLDIPTQNKLLDKLDLVRACLGYAERLELERLDREIIEKRLKEKQLSGVK